MSLARVKAALRRLSPPWPSTETDTSVGKELDSIALAVSMGADPLDTALDETFPDTTEELIDRWELVTRNPVRTTDDIDTRRARVLAVLRRTAGPRLDQLEAMLAAPFDLAVEDIIFYEQTREMIEDGITETDTTTYAITGSPTEIVMGEHWPGVIDDTGVRIYVAISAVGTPTMTLTSPVGTVWDIPVDATTGWYETRTAFLGEVAGGTWLVTASNGSSVNITELRLLVSNDVDSAQIYNFFAYRDPTLAGDADIREAQRLFHRTTLAHMNAHVIQSIGFTVDDEYSLVDRDPVGI